MHARVVLGVGKVERYPQFRSVLIEREGPLHCNAFFLHKLHSDHHCWRLCALQGDSQTKGGVLIERGRFHCTNYLE